MIENLSVRAYEPIEQTHSHDFHQVVVPLQGVILINLDNQHGELPAGHCVVIKKNVVHSFRAKQEARFLVADLCDLPDSAKSLPGLFSPLSSAFRSFCLFAEVQLKSQADIELERNMIAVFKNLLARQEFLPQIDQRIVKAITHIESNLAKDFKLQDTARVSALSVSQLKVLFRKHTGKSVGEYLLTLRMERARALLINTDTPLNIVAESTGYTDHSAFSRRFRNYYGVPPSHYRKQVIAGQTA